MRLARAFVYLSERSSAEGVISLGGVGDVSLGETKASPCVTCVTRDASFWRTRYRTILSAAAVRFGAPASSMRSTAVTKASPVTPAAISSRRATEIIPMAQTAPEASGADEKSEFSPQRYRASASMRLRDGLAPGERYPVMRKPVTVASSAGRASVPLANIWRGGSYTS